MSFALHHDGDLTSTEVDIVLGARFPITSHPTEWHPMAALGSNGRNVAPLLAQATDLRLYALVDALVAGCFRGIDLTSDQICELECWPSAWPSTLLPTHRPEPIRAVGSSRPPNRGA